MSVGQYAKRLQEESELLGASLSQQVLAQKRVVTSPKTHNDSFERHNNRIKMLRRSTIKVPSPLRTSIDTSNDARRRQSSATPSKSVILHHTPSQLSHLRLNNSSAGKSSSHHNQQYHIKQPSISSSLRRASGTRRNRADSGVYKSKALRDGLSIEK